MQQNMVSKKTYLKHELGTSKTATKPECLNDGETLGKMKKRHYRRI